MKWTNPNDPAHDAETLIEALLEDRISPEDAARLERLVCERKDVRQMYLRYMHLHCSLPVHMAADSLAEEPRRLRWQDAEETMAPTEPVPEGREGGWIAPAAKRARGSIPRSSHPLSRRSLYKISAWVSAGLAACVVLAVILHGRRTTQENSVALAPTPAARITGIAGAQWEGDVDLSPGAELEPGHVLRLEEGGAEITFASGATLVMEGQAVLTVVDQNAAILIHGKVAAHVPPPAHGFRITSGKLVVTDLGTEFGLSVSPEGEATVDVFSGKVDVAHRIDAGTEIKTTRLVQGEAVCGSVKAGTIARAESGTLSFARDISKIRLPIPLIDTGLRLKSGASDPNWQVIAESFDSEFKPRAAIVPHLWHPRPTPADEHHKESYTFFALDHRKPARANWVAAPMSPAQLNSVQGKPVSCTFKTSINLSGFDPRSVALEAELGADDSIVDVRINGTSTGVRLNRSPLNFNELHHVKIPTNDLMDGVNTVEFVVAEHAASADFPIGIHVEWAASGCKSVTRQQGYDSKPVDSAD